MPYRRKIYTSQLVKTSTAVLFLWCVWVLSSCGPINRDSKNYPALADSIIDHASEMMNGGRPKLTMPYIDSAYRQFAEAGPIDLWKKYRLKATFYTFYEPDMASASLYTDSMYFVLENQLGTYKQEYAQSILAKGDVLIMGKRYNEAFRHFYEGREFAQKNLDSCSLARFTNWLGLVRYFQEQYVDAIPQLQQAFKETTHCERANMDNFIFRQSNRNTLALSFEKAGELDSAIYYYMHALEVIKEPKWETKADRQFAERAAGVVYGNLGGVYARLNNYDLAKKYLEESIRINSRPGYEVADATTAKVKLADLYIRNNMFGDARGLLDNLHQELGLNLGSRRSQDNLRVTWYKLKWDYHSGLNQLEDANSYAHRYEFFKDSLNQNSSALRNTDMDNVLKDIEQGYLLTIHRKNDHLKTVYLVSLGMVIVLIGTILVLVYNNMKKYQNAHRKIRAQNTHMQQALSALEQSHEDNTRMMKIVAHDLRNPIGAISMAASLITKKNNYVPEDEDLLKIIKKSAAHSLDLVKDLLQIQTKAETLKTELVDLTEMLHYCANLLVHKADAKNQRIHIKAVDVSISAHGGKLWRVISNLIANAVKFSPDDSDIYVNMSIEHEHVLITVRDQGIGIPEGVKDRIFDMFTDAKRPGTAGEQAFGLGLAISKQIIEAHGGKIRFESEEGKGTIFFVELPLTS